MRIILVGSVSTVKRLRVSLGTLVAIEATVDSATETAVEHGFAHAGADNEVAAKATPPESAAPRAARPEVVAKTRSADAAIERAFEAIEQINRLMHPKADGSDLARINNAPLHTPVKVHASIGQLLIFAKRIHALTDGVFDPCTPARPGRLNDIEVLQGGSEVVCRAPVALDFGGFAKGYAVDCAVEALMAAGCSTGLVNAGGDLRVFGRRAEPVFVRSTAGELTNIELANSALAVSDARSQRQPPEHQGYYVRSVDIGPPPAGTQSVHIVSYAAVVATTALIADALTKCVLLCSPAVATRTLRALGAFQPFADHKSSPCNRNSHLE